LLPVQVKHNCVVPWLNWIEQPPPKGQVAGSNPAGVAKTTRKIWLIYRALCGSLQKGP
jgi:hypothetical protein